MVLVRIHFTFSSILYRLILLHFSKDRHGAAGGHQPSKQGGGSIIKKLEKVTNTDLDGDGRVGVQNVTLFHSNENFYQCDILVRFFYHKIVSH